MNFSPVVYEHAAKLINKTPWEVSRNGELLFQAHYEAYQTYHHVPIVVGIPDISPVNELMLKPGGRLPATIDHL